MHKKYYKHLFSVKPYVIILFLTTVFHTLTTGYYVYCYNELYILILAKNEQGFSGLIFRLLIIMALSFILVIFKQIFTAKLQFDLYIKIQKEMLFEVLSYKYEYFLRRNTSKLIKRIIEDCGQIAEGLVKICSGISIVFILTGWFVFLSIFIKTLVIIYIIPVVVFILWTIIWRRAIEKSSYDIGKQYTKMYKILWEIMSGIKTIKMELLGNLVINEIKTVLKNLINSLFRNNIFHNSVWNMNIILPWMTFLTIIFIGMNKLNSGAFTIGMLIICLIFIWRIFEPLNELCGIIISFQEYKTAKQRIRIYSDGEIEKGGVLEFPDEFKFIYFNSLNFHYADNSFILEDLKFKINKGEKIAIMGKTGSGKSTIAHLLLRLYDPVSGDIFINGDKLVDYSLESIRQKMILVPQEPRLYNDTLRKNIDPVSSLSDASVLDLLKKVNLGHLPSKLKDGLDSNIINEGLDLSGGEKQRIGIARALGYSAPVYIFDELTASLDAETSGQIIKVIHNIGKDTTTITISHNPDILPYTDRVIVIKQKGVKILENNEKKLTMNDILMHM